MNTCINSAVIGKLAQSIDFPEWWISEPTKIPLLNDNYLKITFLEFVPQQDVAFITDTDKALGNFLSLTPTYLHSFSELLFKQCKEFLESIGYDSDHEALWNLTDPGSIWNFVHPTEIMVSRRHRRDKDIYIVVLCECDWEEEHGLQLVFRQGQILSRVSDQDGHLTRSDAYNTSDEEDLLLSGFVQK